MQVGLGSGQLLLQNLGAGRSNWFGQSSQGLNGLSGLVGQLAAVKSGGAVSRPGEMKPVFRMEAVYGEQDRFEELTVVERRDVFEEEAIEETRDILAERDIVEERVRYVSRDVTETRDVFEDRAILQTRLEGTKSLSGAGGITAAGVAVGSSFSVAVGQGSAATIAFTGTTKLTVTQNGTTTEFRFKATDGSFKDALIQGLNTVSGLSAALTTDGRLELKSGSERLALANVNGSTALSGLGLQAGTTDPAVVGYERIKTGTEQVVVGTEQVADGTEQVVVGRETYVAGTEVVRVGSRQVKVGEEEVVTGTARVKVGTDRVLEGHTREIIALERTGLPSLLAPSSDKRAAAALPTSIVDMVAGIVKSRDDMFSEAEGRSAYSFVSTLHEADADAKDKPSWSDKREPAPDAPRSGRTALSQR